MATKTTAKVKKVEEKATPSIISAPRVTEKTYSAQVDRTYVFEVPAKASKQAVAKAVEEEHKVTVTSVRVLVRKGKKTRFSRGKHAYPGTTYRQDKKYAYVTLKEGDKIKVEAFEEANEEMAKQEAAAKKTDKKADKADKKSAKTEEKTKKSSEKKGDKK